MKTSLDYWIALDKQKERFLRRIAKKKRGGKKKCQQDKKETKDSKISASES